MVALTLTQAKQFLRYEAADESQDETLDLMLRAGQEWVERMTGIPLVSREIVQQVDRFCGAIELRWWPVISIDSIDYVGTGGDEGTVADPRLLTAERPAKVYPAYSTSWPSIDSVGPHTITYTAGYEDPDDVPAGLLHAMLVYAGMSDEERGGDMSGTVWNALHALIGPYRPAAV